MDELFIADDIPNAIDQNRQIHFYTFKTLTKKNIGIFLTLKPKIKNTSKKLKLGNDQTPHHYWLQCDRLNSLEDFENHTQKTVATSHSIIYEFASELISQETYLLDGFLGFLGVGDQREIDQQKESLEQQRRKVESSDFLAARKFIAENSMLYFFAKNITRILAKAIFLVVLNLVFYLCFKYLPIVREGSHLQYLIYL